MSVLFLNVCERGEFRGAPTYVAYEAVKEQKHKQNKEQRISVCLSPQKDLLVPGSFIGARCAKMMGGAKKNPKPEPSKTYHRYVTFTGPKK